MFLNLNYALINELVMVDKSHRINIVLSDWEY